jgi:hypothetical protein
LLAGRVLKLRELLERGLGFLTAAHELLAEVGLSPNVNR